MRDAAWAAYLRLLVAWYLHHVEHVVLRQRLCEVLLMCVVRWALIVVLGYDGGSSCVAETLGVDVFDFQNWERCGVLLGNRLLRCCLLFLHHPLSSCFLPEQPLSLDFACASVGLYFVYFHKLFYDV